jgi:hypothetical protein
VTPPETRRKSAVALLAAVIALLPGFLFPFILPIVVGSEQSDTYLLGISVAVTLASVFSNAIEMHAVAAFGKELGAGRYPSPKEQHVYVLRVIMFAGAGTLLVGTLLLAVYFFTSHDPLAFLVVSLTVLWVPVVAAFTSVSSGRLIAAGRSVLPVFMQAPRAALPLVVLLTVPQPPLVLLAISLGCAELLRCVVLKTVASRMAINAVLADTAISTRGLTWQSASAAVAQGGPVTDRVFLSSTVGAISAYELADKVFFAAVQFMSLGLLVGRVGSWAQMLGADPKRLTGQYWRDVKFLAMVSSALALGGFIVMFIVISTAIAPDAWQRGLWWAAILITSLPFTVVNMAATRMIIIAGRQSVLAWMSILTLIGNAALDAAFFLVIGVDGIPIATVALRVIATCAYVQLVRRLLQSTAAAT